MTVLSKILMGLMGASLLIFPFVASSQVWGYSSEEDAEVVDLASQEDHRSYFNSRSFSGGSFGSGK
jgi:hypothetical protein